MSDIHDNLSWAIKELKKYNGRQRRDSLTKDIADITKISLDALDKNPHLLNTPGGLVDLRTGETEPNDPLKRCTKITSVSPSQNGNEILQPFLLWLTDGDVQLLDYVQQLVGLAAYGKVYGEYLHIAIGSGGNGKSTFFNAVAAVLGDYAGGMQNKSLLRERYQNSGPDKATLRGRRLILASELEEGAMLDAGQLKQIASTDPIRGEAKYRDPESFIPSHTAILFSNFLPRIESTDDGTWRRIRVLEFKGKVNPEKSVLNFGDVLVEQAGEAILQWIIDGAVKVAQNGFKLPLCAEVERASAYYRKEQDWLPMFLEDNCIVEEGETCKSSELSIRFVNWSQETGNRRRSPKEFAARLRGKGYEKIQIHGYEHWNGLRLRSPFRDADVDIDNQD